MKPEQTNQNKSKLQTLALKAREFPGASPAMAFTYRLAEKLFVRLVKKCDQRLGGGFTSAVYLRRGGGRAELVPGASDLDFFVVLEAITAEREMEFLKEFWASYRRLRNIFPFLGEVLMGDANELQNWLSGGTVRAFEAKFSWKLLAGSCEISRHPSTKHPEPRDIFSEALKLYWEILQPLLKMRSEDLSPNLKAHSRGAVQARHGAKAVVDLFRLHYSMHAPERDLNKIWSATREGLCSLLPATLYGEDLPQLKNLLTLKSPLFASDPFSLLASFTYRAFQVLDEMASSLGKNAEENTWQLSMPSSHEVQDPYSLSVREIFAERMLLRHEPILKRAILSENTAHMYFPLSSLPSEESFRALLLDLRDVNFSFDRFSVAMPLTERTLRELERTSLLDSPFHSFQGHTELVREGGKITSRPYTAAEAKLPSSVLTKTFSELSFALRLEPNEMGQFVERMVGLVLSLRLAADHGEISAGFSHTLERYEHRYPLRVEQLKRKIGPFLGKSESESEAWREIFALLETSHPRATFLKSQLNELKQLSQRAPLSASLPSDAWINLTPFLRMEMNAMKERFFEHRPSLKL